MELKKKVFQIIGGFVKQYPILIGERLFWVGDLGPQTILLVVQKITKKGQTFWTKIFRICEMGAILFLQPLIIQGNKWGYSIFVQLRGVSQVDPWFPVSLGLIIFISSARRCYFIILSSYLWVNYIKNSRYSILISKFWLWFFWFSGPRMYVHLENLFFFLAKSFVQLTLELHTWNRIGTKVWQVP